MQLQSFNDHDHPDKVRHSFFQRIPGYQNVVYLHEQQGCWLVARGCPLFPGLPTNHQPTNLPTTTSHWLCNPSLLTTSWGGRGLGTVYVASICILNALWSYHALTVMVHSNAWSFQMSLASTPRHF